MIEPTTFRTVFERAEREALEFLVARGFRCVDRRVVEDGTMRTSGFARYEATPGGTVPAGWSVTLSTAPLRLELSLGIEDGGGRSFTIEELHHLEGKAPFPAREHGLYEAMKDSSALREEFERLVAVLLQAGERFFAGDLTLWEDLTEQRALARQESEDQISISKSEQAVQRKDWASVVRWLEPIQERLSGVAAARLAYARTRVRDGTTSGGDAGQGDS